jgi:hypothetical protein
MRPRRLSCLYLNAHCSRFAHGERDGGPPNWRGHLPPRTAGDWMESESRHPKGSGANKVPERRNPETAPPVPVRFLVHGLLFGQEALDHDKRPEASSFISDAEVAELLQKTGNAACDPGWLGVIQSLITAFSELRELQARWPKEKSWPDERIARAVGILRSAIPAQIEKLDYEIWTMPPDFHAVRRQEIARLERLLDAAREEPHLPLEKSYESRVDANTMVRHLAKVCDSIYGPGRYWKKSPKTLFVAAAVRKAGWKITEGAVEQQLLATVKRATRRP